jgi:membrane fusion protein (multidrug efflux system)
MRQNTYLRILAITLLFLITSCNNKTQSTEETGRAGQIQQRNLVQIMELQPTTFTKQLVGNGKLTAFRKAELSFRNNGEIVQLPVSNGMRIVPGHLIAALNDTDYRQRLQQSRLALKKAELELQDVLIGMGFAPADSLSIPPEKMELAKTRSGYTNASLDFATAKRNLDDCRLLAPFAGIVANITQKAYEQTSGQAFCTLIDDSKFEVVFQLMENELKEVQKGNAVKVLPYAIDEVFAGKIIEINPVIDNNGLVKVKALVSNTGQLMEGMNVRVLVEKDVPKQYVVPKSAVVLRDNWEVLFKVNNGKAYWNYVKVVYENSSSYAVIPHPEKNTASLNPGDTIIVSGNLNLAHESDIEIE